MKIALVYDRLNKFGGAERVLLAFAGLFPQADWYTSVWNPSRARFSSTWRVKSSFFSHIPFLRDRHELLPMFMPFIFESFDFSGYDLVISIGSAECKGVITKPSTVHLHYCLTPTRYLYSHSRSYLTNSFLRFFGNILRLWDQQAATRPDEMIAISTQVKKRIKKYYKRESSIIFPPLDLARFRKSLPIPPTVNLPDKYFLVVSRLVPYKKIDQLIAAFKKLPHQNLVIVGVGTQMRYLQTIAPPNVSFVGKVSDNLLPYIYAHASAYLQANIEDFGLSMVEAQAAGTPIIAYGQGGAVDIVKSGITGILLGSSTPEAFANAIDNFDPTSFDKEACRANASRFDLVNWQKQIKERIAEYYV